MIDIEKIQDIARNYARNLPRWATIDADDLSQETILSQLEGRSANGIGAMKDLIRKQGWIKQHRSRDKAPLERIGLNKIYLPSNESKFIASIDVNKLLLQLSPAQQQVMRLYTIEGLLILEIAGKLNISAEAVRNRIYWGMRKLRKLANGKSN